MHDGPAIRTGSLFHLHFNPYTIKEYKFFLAASMHLEW